MSERDWSYSELAELTHETQVENFGFCMCEEQEYFPYDDCPKDDGVIVMCDGLALNASRRELMPDGTFYSFSTDIAGEISALVYRDPAWDHGPWKKYFSITSALHDYAGWTGNEELAFQALEIETLWEMEDAE